MSKRRPRADSRNPMAGPRPAEEVAGTDPTTPRHNPDRRWFHSRGGRRGSPPIDRTWGISWSSIPKGSGNSWAERLDRGGQPPGDSAVDSPALWTRCAPFLALGRSADGAGKTGATLGPAKNTRSQVSDPDGFDHRQVQQPDHHFIAIIPCGNAIRGEFRGGHRLGGLGDSTRPPTTDKAFPAGRGAGSAASAHPDDRNRTGRMAG